MTDDLPKGRKAGKSYGHIGKKGNQWNGMASSIYVAAVGLWMKDLAHRRGREEKVFHYQALCTSKK